MRFFNKGLIRLCIGVTASLCIASLVHAADFFIRHQGTVGTSSIAGITAGQPYAFTLVLNNDDDNPNSQTWSRFHVQCMLVQTPGAAFAQSLNNGPLPTPDATGSVTTNATGALTAMFGDISAYANGSVSRPYSQVGLGSLTAPFAWAADGNSNTPVLSDDNGAAFTATGGVPSAPAQWSAPADYEGGCTASLLPAPPPVAAPVPALDGWGVLLLAGLIGAGALGRQRHSMKREALSKPE